MFLTFTLNIRGIKPWSLVETVRCSGFLHLGWFWVEEFAAVVAGGEVGPALEGDGEGGFGAIADAVGYGGDVGGAIEEQACGYVHAPRGEIAESALTY